MSQLPMTLDPELTARALQAVAQERSRQDLQLWGEQNHEWTTWLTILSEEVGEAAQEVLNERASLLREELVQVAAVAVAFIEFLDREEVIK